MSSGFVSASVVKTDGPRVRAAQSSDRNFVVGLATRFGPTRAAWREFDEVVRGTQRQLAKAFDDPGAADVILIAVDSSDEPLGFAFVVTQRDFFTGENHGHISEIATVADGSGAGRALMDASEAWTRERGFRYLSLNVNDTNEAARRFYERRDYVPEYRHLVKLL
jgi:GNAT superfamily N-acetyltransferase